jgi:hypothetical protein
MSAGTRDVDAILAVYYALPGGGAMATLRRDAELTRHDSHQAVAGLTGQYMLMTYCGRSRVAEGLRGFGISTLVLPIDAERAQLNDRRSAPTDRVGRERQRKRHPVLFTQRLVLAQDTVVARR